MTSSVPAPQPPEPVVWPRFWPLPVGMLPLLLLLALALWPPAREFINEHWAWAAVIGVILLPFWFGLLGGIAAHGLDSWLRTFDFVLNRSYGPDVQGNPLFRRIGLLLSRGGLLHGYSLPIVLWTSLALVIVVFGPTRTPLSDPTGPQTGFGLWTAASWLGFLLLLVLLALLFFRVPLWGHRLHQGATLGLVGVVVLVALFLSVSRSLRPAEQVRAEADNFIYPHVFLLFIGLAAAFAYAAGFLARWLVCGFKTRF